ncbi:MAG: DEAD/DEAH box helicase [Pseudomonadota bacterium]
MNPSFADLGLGPDLLAPLAALGYEEPTHIQREAIPLLLLGRDVLAQAATGTGKTAAFALPLLARLPDGRATSFRPFVLVLVPTRELANQVAEAFHRYGGGAGRVVVPIYGGQDFRRQVLGLKRGAHVVVATPGRALDHLRQGTLDLAALQAVVLDEADEMLDMGFAEDIESILGTAPDTAQVALFSATMPSRIAAIAATHLDDPARVRIAQERTPEGAAPRVRQTVYFVPRAHRTGALGRVLDVESPQLALVFCRTRLEVDELAQTLGGHGFRVEAIHGGMSQEQRERVMRNARGGQLDLLIATDVAARGIDIGHLSHVVNYGVPESPETYVHRIGRTGRAGREGVAITIAEPRERRLIRNIERLTRQDVAVETVPSLSDVHARRLDLTAVAAREALEVGDYGPFRGMAEALAGDFDPLDVAAAALQVAHRATSGDDASGASADDFEIPDVRPAERGRHEAHGRAPRAASSAQNADGPRRARRADPSRADSSAPRGADGPLRGRALREARKAAEAAGHDGPVHEFAGLGRPESGPRQPLRHSAGMVRLRVSVGRRAGVRPGDLVGAIANESGVDVRSIGAIDLADHYSLVEVDEALADTVAAALSRTWLRGQKPEVARFDPNAEPAPASGRAPYRGGRRPSAGGRPPRGKRPRT